MCLADRLEQRQRPHREDGDGVIEHDRDARGDGGGDGDGDEKRQGTSSPRMEAGHIREARGSLQVTNARQAFVLRAREARFVRSQGSRKLAGHERTAGTTF